MAPLQQSAAAANSTIGLTFPPDTVPCCVPCAANAPRPARQGRGEAEWTWPQPRNHRRLADREGRSAQGCTCQRPALSWHATTIATADAFAEAHFRRSILLRSAELATLEAFGGCAATANGPVNGPAGVLAWPWSRRPGDLLHDPPVFAHRRGEPRFAAIPLGAATSGLAPDPPLRADFLAAVPCLVVDRGSSLLSTLASSRRRCFLAFFDAPCFGRMTLRARGPRGRNRARRNVARRFRCSRDSDTSGDWARSPAGCNDWVVVLVDIRTCGAASTVDTPQAAKGPARATSPGLASSMRYLPPQTATRGGRRVRSKLS